MIRRTPRSTRTETLFHYTTLFRCNSNNAFYIKRVGGGWLVQNPDDYQVPESEFKIATKLTPTAQQMQDLMFAWKVAKYVKSNAIVFVGNGMTLGVGADRKSTRLNSSH